MDTDYPGAWTHDTPDLSGAELATLLTFDICKTSRRAYFASDTKAWSTVLGTRSSAVIGDSSTFLARGGSNYRILAIGADPLTDQLAACITWEQSVPASSYDKFGYLTDGTGALVAATVGAAGLDGPPGDVLTANRTLSRYGDKWFLYDYNVLSSCRLERINDGLTARENELVSGTMGSGMTWHVHATEADYIYLQRPGAGVGIQVTDSGETETGLTYTGGPVANVIDCDPTGKYVFHLTGTSSITPRYSSDYGASWTDIANLPAMVLNNSRVLNMGDALTWSVILNDSSDGNALKVYLTTNAGASWTEVTGNLTTQNPAATVALMARYA
jgi:hypothetical protein